MKGIRTASAVAVATGVALISGCATPAASIDSEQLRVVTTTGILADLASHVAGDRAHVRSLVPEGADPHSYEPSLRDVREIAYADVALTNYLLLEEQSLIRSIDANLPDGAANVSLAEESVKYAAEIIPLVKNVSLDTVWLGLRVHGSGEEIGVTRTSDIVLTATDSTGPGDVMGYLTGTFGDVDIYFDSSDGFDGSNGYADDSVTMPPEAHTHMSWAFTEPGVYTLALEARLSGTATTQAVDLGESTFTFAVGVNPYSATDIIDPTVLGEGHADFSVELDAGNPIAVYDPSGGGESTHEEYAADEVVIDVPGKALEEIPGDPAYRFLGRAGDAIHQLPQAVLGKHVHGEIDPHLWQNVTNAMAYVELIRDVLIENDPGGASEYSANAAVYLDELVELDVYVTDTIAAIPRANRQLVTTHDAFGYLAAAYDVSIAGFVTPNPATEPSISDRKKLTEVLSDLAVPAVFLEPNLATRSSTLQDVALEQGVEICTIYGDAFDADVTNYVEMMRHNADSLARCLGTDPPRETDDAPDSNDHDDSTDRDHGDDH